MGETLSEKVWQEHVIKSGRSADMDLLYIDMHLIHEVTSPQAFSGMRLNNRRLRHPELMLATEDHNVPTDTCGGSLEEIVDPLSRKQIEAIRQNCTDFDVSLYSMGNANQGIVHMIGPELGATQPGMTIVCGDSHTSTHGAFGSIAWGIGTSDVEHVMATQTLYQKPAKTMNVQVNESAPAGITAKDIILNIMGKIGTGNSGYMIEYSGEAITNLSMEGRMTVCNMSIEAGARAGLIAPDDTTYNYLEGRAFAPDGREWEKALAHWQTLPTDSDAVFSRVVTINAKDLKPYVSWGTNPSQVVAINGIVPDPSIFDDEASRKSAERALQYMDLSPGQVMREIPMDVVFIGSCTNARIEDLRAAAKVVNGRKVAANLRRGLVVPGSAQVQQQAEHEGLDMIFKAAGLEWRNPGCSMCLGMNPDILLPYERCASTSNRNYEGRQGRNGRTHLVSPPVAAATAINGYLSTPADLGVFI
jgi:3-isopropylmalate/(R)-2-methylmalate dehydratase large subunit